MAKMEVKFYVNKSPTIKVSKDLGEAAVKTISVDIPDSVDVVNPVLIIDDSHNEGILPSEVNYMECGAPLNRKYFITAMDYTNAKRVIIPATGEAADDNNDADNNETVKPSKPTGDNMMFIIIALAVVAMGSVAIVVIRRKRNAQ
jgi:LPXTG-motif cell wall-anchored protein